MRYRVAFRPYQRPFHQPLQTHHGQWDVREGLIVRLEDAEGRVGWGEIAPLEWFGSESLKEAIAFCHQLPKTVSASELLAVPDTLPACQFGLASAYETLTQPGAPAPAFPYSHLLPTGAAALKDWSGAWALGARTFKWKIGVNPLANELDWFEQLVHALPDGAHLRLDANGGLSWEKACEWLRVCDRLSRPVVECLEQPLPPDAWDGLMALSHRYTTPIALDESVTTVAQMERCSTLGWAGLMVVKAAIAGFPDRLRHFCDATQSKIIWSSVFETAIARSFIESRLVGDSNPRALGFGVDHWFEDDVSVWKEIEKQWQRL